MTTSRESDTAAALVLKLSRLACDLDEVVCALEEIYLDDRRLAYVELPLHHLTLLTAKLGQLVYEGHKIDDRPRRQRLGLTV